MEWWQAVILGLVEGITEFLPVSSTGHLVIAASLLGLGEDPSDKAAIDAFNIVIQGGAILAVLGLYWPSVVRMLKGLLGRDPGGRRLAINLFVAFIPAGILGPLLDPVIEARLMSLYPVVAALILGGVTMIAIERWRLAHLRHAETPGTAPSPRRGSERRGEGRGEGSSATNAVDAPIPATQAPETDAPAADAFSLDNLTWRQALLIGLAQCIAMWPGTSRSMMTIVGGVLVGLKPRQAAEFSFLLGLPTLGGACLYKLAKNLIESRDQQVPSMLDLLGPVPIALGLITATISAFLAIKWLVAFLNRHGLEPFGWYRIAIGLVLLSLALGGLLSVA